MTGKSGLFIMNLYRDDVGRKPPALEPAAALVRGGGYQREEAPAICPPRARAGTLRFSERPHDDPVHLADYHECLDVVARARNEPASGTSTVKAAIEHNGHGA
jgi:hypothetical protein